MNLIMILKHTPTEPPPEDGGQRGGGHPHTAPGLDSVPRPE
jgi:hypothetical protein